jgi:hypothetical protein
MIPAPFKKKSHMQRDERNDQEALTKTLRFGDL